MFEQTIPSWIDLTYIPALDSDLRMNYEEYGTLLKTLKCRSFDIIFIHSTTCIPEAGHRIVKNLDDLTYSSVLLTGALAANLLPLNFPAESVITVSNWDKIQDKKSDVGSELGGALLDFVVLTGNSTQNDISENNKAALYTVVIITAIIRRAHELFTGRSTGKNILEIGNTKHILTLNIHINRL